MGSFLAAGERELFVLLTESFHVDIKTKGTNCRTLSFPLSPENFSKILKDPNWVKVLKHAKRQLPD